MKTMTAPALILMLGVALGCVFAHPAQADEGPTVREIQSAVDDYLVQTHRQVTLVGGVHDAGYERGFWLRSGDLSLRLNLTLQARYEAWLWDDSQKALLGEGSNVHGHGSGFSLPRATLKFSGTAPCNMRYHLELEFGHFGRDRIDLTRDGQFNEPLGPFSQSFNFDNTREA